MKLITVLASLQVIAILVLSVGVYRLNEQSNKAQLEIMRLSNVTSRLEDLSETPATDRVTINQIRALLQEQLAAQSLHSEFEADSIVSERPAGGEKDRLQLSTMVEVAAVDEVIEFHLSNGKISQLDMINLQTEIVKLDAKNRKLMFKKLVQAMNSGQLEGHL